MAETNPLISSIEKLRPESRSNEITQLASDNTTTRIQDCLLLLSKFPKALWRSFQEMKRKLKPRLPRSQLSILPSHGSICFYTHYTIFIYTILYKYIIYLYLHVYFHILVTCFLTHHFPPTHTYKHTHTPILLAKKTYICLQLAYPGGRQN